MTFLHGNVPFTVGATQITRFHGRQQKHAADGNDGQPSRCYAAVRHCDHPQPTPTRRDFLNRIMCVGCTNIPRSHCDSHTTIVKDTTRAVRNTHRRYMHSPHCPHFLKDNILRPRMSEQSMYRATHHVLHGTFRGETGCCCLERQCRLRELSQYLPTSLSVSLSFLIILFAHENNNVLHARYMSSPFCATWHTD